MDSDRCSVQLTIRGLLKKPVDARRRRKMLGCGLLMRHGEIESSRRDPSKGLHRCKTQVRSRTLLIRLFRRGEVGDHHRDRDSARLCGVVRIRRRPRRPEFDRKEREYVGSYPHDAALRRGTTERRRGQDVVADVMSTRLADPVRGSEPTRSRTRSCATTNGSRNEPSSILATPSARRGR